MHKILVHTIKVQKVGAKLQFQIKLPRVNQLSDGFGEVDKSIGVKELMVTHVPLSDVIKTKKEIKEKGFPEPSYRRISNGEVGWLWLRIPEERDVFYVEAVRASVHKRKLNPFESAGISNNGSWWFDGTKHEFLKVDVKTDRTLIEGFYMDKTIGRQANYEVKIYLKLKLPKDE